MTPHRVPLLFALTLGAALPATAALAASATHPQTGRTSITASAAQEDEADEILLEVASSWKLKGNTITGAVTNGDRDAVSGTAKITRESAHGTPITLATGGKLAVAVGHKQVLTLTLSATGKSYFKHRTKASVELALREKAGTRSGVVNEGIVVRKAS